MSLTMKGLKATVASFWMCKLNINILNKNHINTIYNVPKCKTEMNKPRHKGILELCQAQRMRMYITS